MPDLHRSTDRAVVAALRDSIYLRLWPLECAHSRPEGCHVLPTVADDEAPSHHYHFSPSSLSDCSVAGARPRDQKSKSRTTGQTTFEPEQSKLLRWIAEPTTYEPAREPSCRWIIELWEWISSQPLTATAATCGHS